MARTVIETVTCDVCGGTDRVEKVTINRRGAVVILDLCHKETVTLDEWAAHAHTERGGARAQTQGHRVEPID